MVFQEDGISWVLRNQDTKKNSNFVLKIVKLLTTGYIRN